MINYTTLISLQLVIVATLSMVCKPAEAVEVSSFGELNAALAATTTTSITIPDNATIIMTGVATTPAQSVSIRGGALDANGLPTSTIQGAAGSQIFAVAVKSPYNTGGDFNGMRNLNLTRAVGDTAIVTGNGGVISVAGAFNGGITNVVAKGHSVSGTGGVVNAKTFTGNIANSVYVR